MSHQFIDYKNNNYCKLFEKHFGKIERARFHHYENDEFFIWLKFEAPVELDKINPFLIQTNDYKIEAKMGAWFSESIVTIKTTNKNLADQLFEHFNYLTYSSHKFFDHFKITNKNIHFVCFHDFETRKCANCQYTSSTGEIKWCLGEELIEKDQEICNS